MSAERREHDRKITGEVSFSELTSLTNYLQIASQGLVVDASISGFLITIDRNDILLPELRDTLSLQNLIGQHVCLFLSQMNIDLDGHIIRADHLGKGLFEIAIEFTDDVPEYWRACLFDLLPTDGNFM